MTVGARQLTHLPHVIFGEPQLCVSADLVGELLVVQPLGKRGSSNG